MKKWLLLPFVLFLFFACESNKEVVESIEVYGHAYGNPKHKIKGIYPPLKTHIENVDSNKQIVFAGDFVRRNDSVHVEQFISEVSSFRQKSSFLRANHEFIYNNDSLSALILNQVNHLKLGNASIYLWEVYENEWNLTDKQIQILKGDHSDLIVIITPEVFWWELIEEERNRGEIDLRVFSRQFNSDHNKSKTPDFKRVVLPILKEKKEVILISGDAGALNYVSPYYVVEYENVKAVNTGMALGEIDNFVEINLLSNGKVELLLKRLDNKEVIEELN